MSKVIIGIDPGTTTGMAVVVNGELVEVKSDKIHNIMNDVLKYKTLLLRPEIVLEDARMMKNPKWLDFSIGRRQGVGSVKRDCQIWQDFLEDNGISYRLRHPKNTKIKADQFREITGWEGRTNQHGRDAAMAVYYAINKLKKV